VLILNKGNKQFTTYITTRYRHLEQSQRVPQGSVLGPLLFVLYLSDFGDTLRYCKYNFYADDLLIYAHADPADLVGAIQRVNEDIRYVVEWAASNKLTLNSGKTSAMILGTARYVKSISLDTVPCICVDNVSIQYRESVIYLGITISNILTWDLGSLSVKALRASSASAPAIEVGSVPHIAYIRLLLHCYDRYNRSSKHKALESPQCMHQIYF